MPEKQVSMSEAHNIMFKPREQSLKIVFTKTMTFVSL
jgi:hypothetical protein